jgi:hypothetical protein
MDPFVEVWIAGGSDEKFKTKVVKDGHQNPTFEQSYIFNLIGQEDLLHVNVWHEATLGNDHIGRVDVALDLLDMSDKPHAYQLKDRSNFSQQTGDIFISMKFEGHGLPEGSFAFKTHESRLHPEGVAPVQTPNYAQPPPQPQYVSQAPPQQQQYQSPPPQQQYQQPPPQQYQQQPPQQYQQPPPQQYQQPPVQYQSQAPVYQTQAPIYQSQPVYQAPPQPVYAAPPPVYQPVYQQPAPVFIQPQIQFAPAPTVVYQQTAQIIGYWPNGAPRYAGQ